MILRKTDAHPFAISQCSVCWTTSVGATVLGKTGLGIGFSCVQRLKKVQVQKVQSAQARGTAVLSRRKERHHTEGSHHVLIVLLPPFNAPLSKKSKSTPCPISKPSDCLTDTASIICTAHVQRIWKCYWRSRFFRICTLVDSRLASSSKITFCKNSKVFFNSFG